MSFYLVINFAIPTSTQELHFRSFDPDLSASVDILTQLLLIRRHPPNLEAVGFRLSSKIRGLFVLAVNTSRGLIAMDSHHTNTQNE